MQYKQPILVCLSVVELWCACMMCNINNPSWCACMQEVDLLQRRQREFSTPLYSRDLKAARPRVPSAPRGSSWGASSRSSTRRQSAPAVSRSVSPYVRDRPAGASRPFRRPLSGNSSVRAFQCVYQCFRFSICIGQVTTRRSICFY